MVDSISAITECAIYFHATNQTSSNPSINVLIVYPPPRDFFSAPTRREQRGANSKPNTRAFDTSIHGIRIDLEHASVLSICNRNCHDSFILGQATSISRYIYPIQCHLYFVKPSVIYRLLAYLRDVLPIPGENVRVDWMQSGLDRIAGAEHGALVADDTPLGLVFVQI